MGKQKYSNEFREEAVKLVEKGNVPVSQVARDLGMNPEILRRWVHQFGSKPKADGTRIPTPEEYSELLRLRRENRILKEERDIQKGAMGIFTRELP